MKAILKRSGKNTLVIADEVCKGTEHKSALVIVSTMLKMLINSQTSFISATHLHELVKIDQINNLQNLKVYHLSVTYENGSIIFNRLLNKGNGTEEYGFGVRFFSFKNTKLSHLSITNSSISNRKRY